MKFDDLLTAVGNEPLFETGLLLACDVDPRHVRRQLSRWTSAGRLVQLRRGLYALAPPWRKQSPHPFLIANHLAPGSYVSGASALAFAGAIPENVPRDYELRWCAASNLSHAPWSILVPSPETRNALRLPTRQSRRRPTGSCRDTGEGTARHGAPAIRRRPSQLPGAASARLPRPGSPQDRRVRASERVPEAAACRSTDRGVGSGGTGIRTAVKEYLRELVRDLSIPWGRSAAREYFQARILEALQRSGAMTSLAFQGGTCLRFLFSLPRHSEDLDFALENPRGYDLRGYLGAVRSALQAEDYGVDIRLREHRTGHSVVVRLPGILYEIGLSPHASEVVAIKIEVDTRPPAGH